MSTDGSSNTSTRHAGCKIFVAPNGLSGIVVGAEGDRAGWLYDFFVSPRAETLTAYNMMSLASKQGADKLVIHEHLLLARFFEQFGFQATARVGPASWNDIPANWRPELRPGSVSTSCPTFVYMIRIASGFTPAPPHGSGARSSSGEATDAPEAACARCGQAVAHQRNDLGMFGGYDCPKCGFLYVYGTLTMGPRTDTSS